MKQENAFGKCRKIIRGFELEPNCELKIGKTVISNGTKIGTKPKLFIISGTESKLFCYMGIKLERQFYFFKLSL